MIHLKHEKAFQIDPRLLDFITADDEAKTKFTNYMLKVHGVESVTFNKFMGAIVWATCPDPHGRFILLHEVVRDRIVKFQQEFLGG